MLWITLDYLVSGDKDEKVKTSLKDAELLQQFKAVEQFADDDKIVVKKLIDTFIVKKQLLQMVSWSITALYNKALECRALLFSSLFLFASPTL